MATAFDAPIIRRMIADARLNPLGLDWRRFLIVEAHGEVIGIGQVKQHGDGSRELASICVVPRYHGQGIGTQIIETLLVREAGTVYLMCAPALEGYYQRFGFAAIALGEMPPYFKRLMWLVMPIMRVARLFAADAQPPLVMRRLALLHTLE
jgi:N-acetylglutamate synthase-like GNAT family acetyltransferase